MLKLNWLIMRVGVLYWREMAISKKMNLRVTSLRDLYRNRSKMVKVLFFLASAATFYLYSYCIE